MLKYAFSKYTSSPFHLFNLIVSELHSLIPLAGYAGMCCTSASIYIIPKKHLIRILFVDNRQDNEYSYFGLHHCYC